jgi:hypothetical protein
VRHARRELKSPAHGGPTPAHADGNRAALAAL